jgi:hypothetical protein
MEIQPLSATASIRQVLGIMPTGLVSMLHGRERVSGTATTGMAGMAMVFSRFAVYA